jgi:hypothetical protein
MSLNFQYLGTEDTKLWTKDDWNTYNSLIWGTMVAGISYLCEETANEYCRRVNALRVFNEDIKKENIVKFFGLSTNAEMRTSHQWAVMHFADRNKCDNKWVNKMLDLKQEAYDKKHTTETANIPR